MNFAYTYVLKCADDDMYIGSTDDLQRRVREHADGACDNTRKARRRGEQMT
ncbi:MAG: GIY-YIG nuclease family protein [Kiritimatiellia bacterium]|nr:GIY-YIG nuclease family protein [Kiritimatiellia bacterium]MDP6631800.1 GIY-YIG nuclease family protein [Kiritimatiellia bacterium]MDP6810443.1 GIY-YIG nuclease family protein [Kiritimatiellia bacterium]MDP7024536.1 GIY-YIG nuclease family protein [Kiritimatiellia bacterium]